MGGWKTWTGAALIAVSSGLIFLGGHGCVGCTELADAIYKLGEAFLGVGLGHKFVKGVGAITELLKK